MTLFRTPSDSEHEYLRNGQRYPKSENYLTDSISTPVGRKKFGELWSTNHGDLEVQLYPQNQLFRKTIFRPLKGAVPPILHVLENDQVVLLHPHWVPLTISSKGGPKLT